MPRFKVKSRDTRLARSGEQSSSTPAQDNQSPFGLRVLYDPAEAIVDIIFVHGLGGNLETTWTAKGSSEPWPLTMLPQIFPEAGILSFGYRATTGSISDLSETLLLTLSAQREYTSKVDAPIIFVAHSLGGIVVEQCLVMSHNTSQPHHQKIWDCTRGIIFLGTPQAQLRPTLTNVVSRAALRMQDSDLLEFLTSNSEDLDRIQDSFRTLLGSPSLKRKFPIAITCFFEELSSTAIGMLIVPRESASIPGYNSIGLARSHEDMGKFENKNDVDFVKISAELSHWIRDLAGTLHDEPSSSPSLGSQEKTPTLIRKNSLMVTRDFDQESQALLLWLTTLNFEPQQGILYSQHFDRTGDWFLHSQKFESWVKGEPNTPSLFWCHGPPGAGKSVLTSIVVQHLKASFQNASMDDVAVAFLYCDYKSLTAQTTLSLLGSLSQQLILQAGRVPTEAWRLYRRHDHGASSPTLQEYDYFLTRLLSLFSRSFILVDGVDELGHSERRDLLEILLNLRLGDVEQGSSCSLYLSSRQLHDISNRLESYEHTTLRIESASTDFKKYAMSKILDVTSFRLARRLQQDPELAEFIANTIVDRAQGMFLLVRLSIDSLCELVSIRQVREALNAPSELESAYSTAMYRVYGQGHFRTQLALSALSWVENARRPLKFGELQQALAVQENSRDLDIEGLVEDESDILSVCSGLLVRDENGTLLLIHNTLREYLFVKRPSLPPPLRLPQFHLLKACLTYLQFDSFSTGYLPDDQQFEAQMQKYPFLDYAAKYWGEHYRLAIVHETEIAESMIGFANKFLLKEKNVSCAVQVMQLPKESSPGYSQCPPRKVSALWLVASFGLIDLVRYQIGLGVDIDEKTSNGETSLYAAICGRHYEVVQALIDAGLDLNIEAGKFGNALQAAAAIGSEEIIELLLRMGADPNCKCGKYGTALQAAAAHGQEGSVKLLLVADVDVNAQAGDYGTALRAASSNGYETIVEMLLQMGADLDIQGGTSDSTAAANTSALFEAVAGGSESIVRLLLMHGADVNGSSKTPGSIRPLHKAIQSGHLAVVTSLLEHGADLDAQSEEGTALHWAARVGDLSIVRLLLESGADIEAQDKRHRTPLLVAGEETDARAVSNLLLSAGADLEARDVEGSTPLIAAASNGHVLTVSILLERGADIEATNEEGTTPLIAAVSSGYVSIARLLLDKGANAEARRKDEATALTLAAIKGDWTLVALLLQHGAQITSTT